VSLRDLGRWLHLFCDPTSGGGEECTPPPSKKGEVDCMTKSTTFPLAEVHFDPFFPLSFLPYGGRMADLFPLPRGIWTPPFFFSGPFTAICFFFPLQKTGTGSFKGTADPSRLPLRSASFPIKGAFPPKDRPGSGSLSLLENVFLPQKYLPIWVIQPSLLTNI